jgi:hypothetical protein
MTGARAIDVMGVEIRRVSVKTVRIGSATVRLPSRQLASVDAPIANARSWTAAAAAELAIARHLSAQLAVATATAQIASVRMVRA